VARDEDAAAKAEIGELTAGAEVVDEAAGDAKQDGCLVGVEDERFVRAKVLHRFLLVEWAGVRTVLPLDLRAF